MKLQAGFSRTSGEILEWWGTGQGREGIWRENQGIRRTVPCWSPRHTAHQGPQLVTRTAQNILRIKGRKCGSRFSNQQNGQAVFNLDELRAFCSHELFLRALPEKKLQTIRSITEVLW